MEVQQRYLKPLLGAIVIVIVDFASKWWAYYHVSPQQTTPIVGDFIGLRLVFNPGAAFSLGESFTRVITIFALLFVFVLIPYLLRRMQGRIDLIAITLLWGGATGNLIDRLFYEPGLLAGHVVDFIAYSTWFVGNVADIAITIGAVLLFFSAISSSNTKEQKATSSIKEGEKNPLDMNAEIVSKEKPVDTEKSDA